MRNILWKQRGWFLALIVCGGIFLLIFLLYHLPIQAAIYPTCLCLAFLAFCFGANGIRKNRKIKQLSALSSLPDDLPERLEEFTDEDSLAWRRIIGKLWNRERQNVIEKERQAADQLDYYTTWAHQIKTPIASIRLSLENEDSELGRNLQEELHRIEQYVEMVLTYQRLEGVNTDYVFRECDLDGLIKSVLRKFAGQFIRKGIRLEYVPVNTKIITDEKWISFVLEQVLSNALKYTREGTVSIGMEGDCLFVRDTGIGIDPSDLPRIFERGYTGNNGRTDKSASGLGLYLCHRICRNLGYEISAESTLGNGTCIRLNVAREPIILE